MRNQVAFGWVIVVFAFLLVSFISITKQSTLIVSEGSTIKERFQTPKGFERIVEPKHSFGEYLRNLPLKPQGTLVRYFNGNTKSQNHVYEAVVDLPIGNKDLHQCADAVMRLRADYFYDQKQYDKIHFNFTNGFRVDYSKWRQGYRIAVKGNKTNWVKATKPSDSYEDYWKYLEIIFNYAGTASLAKEMNAISISELKLGDVFIKGGFPGHAVIVVDVAVNPTNKQKIFLLAQSYMPAQELQVLKNPNGSSCWYDAAILSVLETPEWTFKSTELKRF
jgi:Domain of unknown function (4846)